MIITIHKNLYQKTYLNKEALITVLQEKGMMILNKEPITFRPSKIDDYENYHSRSVVFISRLEGTVYFEQDINRLVFKLKVNYILMYMLIAFTVVSSIFFMRDYNVILSLKVGIIITSMVGILNLFGILIKTTKIKWALINKIYIP